MVSTRLWLAGVVQPSRDRSLADQMPVPSSPMCNLLATSAGVDWRLGGLCAPCRRLWNPRETRERERARTS